MRGLILLCFVLLSCNQNKDQWVLQSYDKDKGYTFVRNGVQYETTCVATGRPVLGPNNVPDTSPDALPPDVARHESECEDILYYLHKPIPNLRQAYGSILLFTKENNWRLEFQIKHAK